MAEMLANISKVLPLGSCITRVLLRRRVEVASKPLVSLALRLSQPKGLLAPPAAPTITAPRHPRHLVQLARVPALLKCLLTSILISTLALAACGQGTETGNPASEEADGGGTELNPTYTNDEFGVSLEYDDSWDLEEFAERPEGTTADGDSDDGEPLSAAPSTEFTDGETTVTLFFVTLTEEPESLLSYLQSVFSSRDFEAFENNFIPGFTYDNPEAGATGGDRQEYYFLNGTTLVYIVTDLYPAGEAAFATLIESLHFD